MMTRLVLLLSLLLSSSSSSYYQVSAFSVRIGSSSVGWLSSTSSSKRRTTTARISQQRQKVVVSFSSTDNDGNDEDEEDQQQFQFQHPLIQSLWPALQSYRHEYGHVNIPLGSREGRTCETLRRWHVRGQLPPDDVTRLTEQGFRWHSLEDVYRTTEFDTLFRRLTEYRERTGGDVSPPKKYDADPELGAWTVGLRRIGRDHLPPAQVERLEALGFAWTSPRRCGSSFMKHYRLLQEQIHQQQRRQEEEEEDDDDTTKNVNDDWKTDPAHQRWIRAIQVQHARQTLSATRVHYMEQLLGQGWETMEF